MGKHIIIIGGGPAGIEAARTAAKAGAKATIISEGPIGGRAVWHSLLPSKVWLSAADTAGLLDGTPYAGKPDLVTPGEILSHLRRIKENWNLQQAEELNAMGVQIIDGLASFDAPGNVLITDKDGQKMTTITGEAFILAPGSVPFFPPDLKPDGRKIIAPRFMSALEELPKSIAIIGAGATGTEVVYLFNRLGVEVTWIVDKYGVLPDFKPSAGEFMADILVKRGVHLVRVDQADHIEYVGDDVAIVMPDGTRQIASMAFIAIGRSADLKRLNLDNAGLEVGKRNYLETNPFCQTSVPEIYAVGDVSGPPMVANRAMAMARVAGFHAAGVDVTPFNPSSVIAAIYSDPQVAQVGKVESESGHILTTRISYGNVLKTHFLPEADGFAELAYDHDRKVTGGLAVGPHAGDVLAPVALAVQVGASLDDMAAIYAAHPTLSELAFAAARQVTSH